MNNYGQIGAAIEKQAQCLPSTYTLRDNLKSQLQQAKANVLRIEELLSLLDANPQVDRILELLQKGY